MGGVETGQTGRHTVEAGSAGVETKILAFGGAVGHAPAAQQIHSLCGVATDAGTVAVALLAVVAGKGRAGNVVGQGAGVDHQVGGGVGRNVEVGDVDVEGSRGGGQAGELQGHRLSVELVYVGNGLDYQYVGGGLVGDGTGRQGLGTGYGGAAGVGVGAELQQEVVARC